MSNVRVTCIPIGLAPDLGTALGSELGNGRVETLKAKHAVIFAKSHFLFQVLQINSPLPLNQDELVVTYYRNNGQQILLNCLRDACPGTVWLSI